MAEPAPVQFRLKSILAITAAIALFFAAGSWYGVMGYVAFFLATITGSSCMFRPFVDLPAPAREDDGMR